MRKTRLVLALAPLIAGWTSLGATPVGVQEGRTKEEKPAEKKEEPKKAALAEIGKPAPDFELKDLDGKAVKLADHKGKIVVLEWFNPDCPAVISGHSKGTLKDMAARSTAEREVVWLAVNSGGPGKQGHAVEANKKRVEEWKIGHPILRDEKGDVGRAYGAKSTPHMMVIDAKGVLAYRGAPDNAPNGTPPEGEELVNYVTAAISALKAGKVPETKETRSYG